jgi:hypothetical protein
MNKHNCALIFFLITNTGFATYACQSSGAEAVKLSDKIMIQEGVDGLYSHKSPGDMIAIIGFVTERRGSDATFRDCSGKISTVKIDELKRVRRNCPAGGPGGIWILDAAGKIVPLNHDADYVMMGYFPDGKAQIDPAKLPSEYKQRLEAAKPGAWVAVSYPGDKGKLDLSFINPPKRNRDRDDE